MALSDQLDQLDQLDELARKHGATSYRNRADTQHPAYGFTPSGLLNLLAEVQKQDTALIRQLSYYLDRPALNTEPVVKSTIAAARARLEGKP